MKIPSPNKTWAIFGTRGKLGSEFVSSLAQKRQETREFNRDNFDLTVSLSKLKEEIQGCDVVVNCIAYTNVDLADTERDKALEVNAKWPEKLAVASAMMKIPILHVSTDYVFSGNKKGLYEVKDATNPISFYGRSKLEGEKLVLAAEGQPTIFRTAWLYSDKGTSFPKLIVNKLKQGNEVKVVNDQFGSPTWARDLAELMIQHFEIQHLPPIVHATSSGITNWFEFAREIAESLGFDKDLISAINSDQLARPARRPKNSALASEPSPAGHIGHWRDRWEEASALFLE